MFCKTKKKEGNYLSAEVIMLTQNPNYKTNCKFSDRNTRKKNRESQWQRLFVGVRVLFVCFKSN